MKTRVRLSLYEREIVQGLVEKHRLNDRAARNLVVQYIEVIRKLGGYDNPVDHADRLARAEHIGYAPQAWLQRIREIEQDEAADRALQRQRPPYAHV